MRCVCILSNLTARAAEGSFNIFRYGPDRLTTNLRYLAAGTYTFTGATDPDPETGKDITCYIEATDSSGANKTIYPAAGETQLPYTITLSRVSRVSLYFGYEGFRDIPFGQGDPIELDAVYSVEAAKSGAPAADSYESRVIGTEELTESDVLAEEISAKSTIPITVLPCFEAWGFAKRGTTLVRILDLDRAANRMIFKGRVTAISDKMGSGGDMAQILTCVSGADFLEDTGVTDGIALQSLADWLGTITAEHNSRVELARRFTFTVTGAAKAFSNGAYLCESHYKALTEVLGSGKYLSQGTGDFVKGYTMEWRERYQNDVLYIDIAESPGETKSTPFKIGDNIKEVNIEKGLDGGIYTSVMAVSGVNADGYRYAVTALNDEMFTAYDDGRQLVLINDEIYFTGEGGRDYQPNGTYNWYSTPATQAMEAALTAWAREQAAKLSDPPIKITLSAADLAEMGLSGYERFELGNRHPVVCPKLGLHGRLMRITAIKRRITDGQIQSITVACGQAPSGTIAAGSISKQMARLGSASSGASDVKSAEIAATKAEEQTGGYTWVSLTKSQYDAMPEHDGKTHYVVDNAGTTEYYIGDDRITSEGGGGGSIDTAVIMSGEQGTEWIPAHELVDVSFRGSATVYYAGAPARIVVQGQRALFGVSNQNILNADIMSEVGLDFRDGTSQKLEVYVHKLTTDSIKLGVMCFSTTGGSDVFVGSAPSADEWTIPTGSTIQIGMVLGVSELYDNGSGHLAPRYGLSLVVRFSPGGSVGVSSIPQIAGSAFTGSNADFGSDAEEGYASGLTRKTFPS